MAQPRVTDFFTSRKRNLDVQPSKRRKVALEDAVVECVTSKDKRIRTKTTTRSSARGKPKTWKSASACLLITKPKCSQSKTLASPLDLQEGTIKSIKSPESPSGESVPVENGKTSDILPPEESTYVVGDNGNFQMGTAVSTPFEAKSVSTAACDNHNVSPSSTPAKRRVNNETVSVSTKRSRVTKTTRRDLLSSLESAAEGVQVKDKGFNFKPFTHQHDEKVVSDELVINVKTSRKTMQPLRQSTDSSDCKTKQSSPCKFIFRGSVSRRQKILLNDNEPDATEDPPVTLTGEQLKKSSSDESVKEETTPSVTIAKNVKSTYVKTSEPKVQQAKNKVLPVSRTESRLQISPTDCGQSSSKDNEKKRTKDMLDAASFREKLAKCGQLSELKERLAAFGKAKKYTPKLTSPVKNEISNNESPKKAPAFERFHSLASPVPPSLTLPYHYKILDEMFRGVDTVVSMLHQRSELCTFAKLKTAVQRMVKRTFDEKNLGRIKTVYPKAYVFRQEKGLPYFMGKNSGSQLTLEAILEDKQKQNETSGTKVNLENFTAADLLERKTVFHRNLINIVKKHHQEFLAKLDRPLSIPDDKITRWHPKFRLDEVPAVEASPLPMPPDTTTFTTAKDVLEQAKSKFNPRVQKALEIVSALSANKESIQEKTEKKPATPNKTGNSSKNSLAGVPQSLLERIRAKEEKKLETEMTRTPAQARHIDTLSRLPELVRILRTFFVTQKKVAIPVDDVVQKLSDSYRTSLGKAESERHLKLMVELLPEWVQMVSVKKGRFIKVDKNHDVQQIYTKIQMMLKQSS